MGKPVYNLFIMNNNIAGNVAWKALGQSGQKTQMDQQQASLDSVKAEMVVACESAWADEMRPYWGVIRFPDLQARIAHTRTLQKIGWLDINDAYTLLGTSDEAPKQSPFPNPIYQLWITRADPVTAANYARLTKEEETALWAKWEESVNRTGCVLLSCDSAWADEAHPNFGVMAYPSIEAREEHVKDLRALNWSQYISAFTLLGTPFEGV